MKTTVIREIKRDGIRNRGGPSKLSPIILLVVF